MQILQGDMYLHILDVCVIRPKNRVSNCSITNEVFETEIVINNKHGNNQYDLGKYPNSRMLIADQYNEEEFYSFAILCIHFV